MATGELSVRALRLDLGRVVAVQQADGGRKLEVTEQAGKAIVLRRAVTALLNDTPFIGRVIILSLFIKLRVTLFISPIPVLEN